MIFQVASGNLFAVSRQARNTPGGLVYHVLNRANGRLRLFRKDEDFLAFEKVLLEAMKRRPGAAAGLVPDIQSLAFRRVAQER